MVNQGIANVGVLRLDMVTDAFSGVISQITVNHSGTGPDADISRIRLYLDTQPDQITIPGDYAFQFSLPGDWLRTLSCGEFGFEGDFKSEQLKILEEEGDAVYHEAMGALFAEGGDALEVVKWKDLYDKIEDALDQCEDVGNVLQSIALKNA